MKLIKREEVIKNLDETHGDNKGLKKIALIGLINNIYTNTKLNLLEVEQDRILTKEEKLLNATGVTTMALANVTMLADLLENHYK